MLREPITLDAAMTAREALRRLADNGLWLDPTHDGARERIAEYVARENAAAQAVHEQPITEVEAARQLARDHERCRIVVRREEGVTVYWYEFPVDYALEWLERVAPDVPVRESLDLHEYGAVGTADASSLSRGEVERFSGVVLRGGRPVAVARAEPPKMGGPFDGITSGAEPRGGDRSAASPPPPPPAPAPPSAPMAGAPAPGMAAPPAPAPAPLPAEIHPYPFIDAPEVVEAGDAFDVTIGLSAEAVDGVFGGPFTVVVDAPTIDFDVTVAADGFDAPDGWTRRLTVPVSDYATPRVTVKLVATAQERDIRLTRITVQYAVKGVVCGNAYRQLAVVKAGGQVDTAADPRGRDWLDQPAAAATMRVRTDLPAPDITLEITKPDDLPDGRFVCTITNAHDVPVPPPAKQAEISLGKDPGTFARDLITQMTANAKRATLPLHIDGIAATVGAQLPKRFWDVLRAVHAKVKAEGAGRPVTMQLISAEPYVPWELALVKPALDADAPPGERRPAFLGAQVALARWIAGADEAVEMPPRTAVEGASMAVLAGKYNTMSGLRALPEAQAEVETLAQRYQQHPAVRLACDDAAISELLEARIGHNGSRIGVHVVHFAGHGEVDPTRPGDAALYLDSGEPLTPMLFRNTSLGEQYRPFLFLNACMVGAAGEVLGDYGGFPGACLNGGFSAMAAPLWAVDDKVASQVALNFYEQAFGSAASSGRPVAEIFRDLRGAYRRDKPISTLLAYVFYGNPHFTLRGAKPAAAQPAAASATPSAAAGTT